MNHIITIIITFNQVIISMFKMNLDLPFIIFNFMTITKVITITMRFYYTFADLINFKMVVVIIICN